MPSTARSIPLLLASALLAGGCSQPTEDVRLTLCRDVAAELISSAEGSAEGVVWGEHEAVINGYRGMEVRIRFEPADQSTAEARCFYDYDEAAADYSDAHTLANPTSVYHTYPVRMTLRGEPVAAPLLAAKVNAAMVRQGLRGVERAEEAIRALPKVPDAPADGEKRSPDGV